MPVVQGFLFTSEGPHEDRSGTVCKIDRRATEHEGELLSAGPAFWVYFGDDPDTIYFAHGYELSPWYPID
jgi:hypothetical protein